LVGPDVWLEIGAMEIDDDALEEISFTGCSTIHLTTTMKERWEKKISQDEQY
jgi:hypothetical protein